MANDKIVTGSTLAYFKRKQDEFNTGKFAGKAYEEKVNTLETKVDGIEAGAQVNVIEKIKMNKEELDIVNKTVDLGTIATSEALEELEERVDTAEGNITTLQSDMTTAKSDIATAKSDITTLKTEVGTTPVAEQIQSAIATEISRADAAIATAKGEAITASTVIVEKLAEAESGFAATYIVKQNGTKVGASINIPKDFLVKSGSVKTCTQDDDPVEGYKVGDKYIDFVINTKEGTGTESHIYILVKELVDVYTAGEGIDISSSNVISIKTGVIPTIDSMNTAISTAVSVEETRATNKETELATSIAGKQDTLVAGTNISIAADGKTISATDTIYTHPVGDAPSKTLGLYKISTDSTSHVASTDTVAYSDLPITAENLRSTLEVVTTSEIDGMFTQ